MLQEDLSRVFDICIQCGLESEKFEQGYCVGCYEERQNELGVFNAQYDYWNSLTVKEQWEKINAAY